MNKTVDKTQKTIRLVDGTMSLEGLSLSESDKSLLVRVGNGEISLERAIKEADERYGRR
jgi:hypothetical protein